MAAEDMTKPEAVDLLGNLQASIEDARARSTAPRTAADEMPAVAKTRQLARLYRGISTTQDVADALEGTLAELDRLRAEVTELENVQARAREFVAASLDAGALDGRRFTILRSTVGMGGADWRALDPRGGA